MSNVDSQCHSQGPPFSRSGIYPASRINLLERNNYNMSATNGVRIARNPNGGIKIIADAAMLGGSLAGRFKIQKDGVSSVKVYWGDWARNGLRYQSQVDSGKEYVTLSGLTAVSTTYYVHASLASSGGDDAGLYPTSLTVAVDTTAPTYGSSEDPTNSKLFLGTVTTDSGGNVTAGGIVQWELGNIEDTSYRPDTDGIALSGQAISLLARRTTSPHKNEWTLNGAEGMNATSDNYSLRVAVGGAPDFDVTPNWDYQHTYNSANSGGANPSVSSVAGVTNENKLSLTSYTITIASDNATDVSVVGGASQIYYWLNLSDVAHLNGSLTATHIDIASLLASGSFNHDVLPDVVATPGNVDGHDEVYWRAFNTTGDTSYESNKDYFTTGDTTVDQSTATTFYINATNFWTAARFVVDAATLDVDIEAATTVSLQSGTAMTIASSLTLSIASTGEMDLTPSGLLDINALAGADIDVTGALAIDATTTINIDATTALDLQGGTTANLHATTNLTLGADMDGSLVASGVLSLSGASDGTIVLDAQGVTLATASGDITANPSTGVVNIAVATGELQINGTKVVDSRQATVADPSGGGTQDAEARTAIIALIDRLQAHGLIS